jgi:hypothetical protein
MNLFLGRWKEYFEVNAALPDGLWETATDSGIPEHSALVAALPSLRAAAARDRRRLVDAATEFSATRGWGALGGLFAAVHREECRIAEAMGRHLQGLASRGGVGVRGWVLREDWTPGRPGRAWFEKSLTEWVSETLISVVAYRCFAEVARTGGMKALFRRVLADRTAHAAFGSALLHAIRSRTAPPEMAAAWRKGSAHRFLHSAMAPVSFFAHREALQAGGHGLWTFQEACCEEFDRAFDPESLRRPAIPEPGSWVDEEGPGVRLRWEAVEQEVG